MSHGAQILVLPVVLATDQIAFWQCHGISVSEAAIAIGRPDLSPASSWGQLMPTLVLIARDQQRAANARLRAA